MSIDGKSHEDILLIAVGSGVSVAVIILIILTTLIKHKKKCDNIVKQQQKGLSLEASPSSSTISTSYDKPSNAFKFFGKSSQSSFDLRVSETNLDHDKNNLGSVAINIENYSSTRKQYYRKNILTPSMLNLEDKSKYIQTITC